MRRIQSNRQKHLLGVFEKLVNSKKVETFIDDVTGIQNRLSNKVVQKEEVTQSIQNWTQLLFNLQPTPPKNSTDSATSTEQAALKAYRHKNRLNFVVQELSDRQSSFLELFDRPCNDREKNRFILDSAVEIVARRASVLKFHEIFLIFS
jgi:hypothetical protein